MKRWALLVAALNLLIYGEPAYWIWVIVMVGCEFALLAVPARVASRRPITRGALWPTVLVAGLMMGILVAAAFVTWVIWAVVFGRAAKSEAPRDLVTRHCRLLFQGSILELMIAVPTHIVARYRDYCCAGFMTFIGLAMGISVMPFAFGPAFFFLFAERWRRLHPERHAVTGG